MTQFTKKIQCCSCVKSTHNFRTPLYVEGVTFGGYGGIGVLSLKSRLPASSSYRPVGTWWTAGDLHQTPVSWSNCQVYLNRSRDDCWKNIALSQALPLRAFGRYDICQQAVRKSVLGTTRRRGYVTGFRMCSGFVIRKIGYCVVAWFILKAVQIEYILF